MPFKSEKQRRYLWAKHPEIAKEWADKYPESNKNLPMYANKKKSPSAHIPESQPKSASINISNLVNRYVNNCKQHAITTANTTMSKTDKTADSKQERVDIPHSSEPVYAGEEREKGKIEGEIPTGMNVGESCEQKPKNAINELLTKLSVVLSPHIEQTMENLEAEREGRVPRRIPKNRGVKQYPCGGINIMPPMGLAQNPQQNQQSQPNNQYPSRPVGGGSHPQFNPIQAFGALSTTGVINGNAAFGAKNSPDSSKIAEVIKRAFEWQGRRMSDNVEDLRTDNQTPTFLQGVQNIFPSLNRGINHGKWQNPWAKGSLPTHNSSGPVGSGVDEKAWEEYLNNKQDNPYTRAVDRAVQRDQQNTPPTTITSQLNKPMGGWNPMYKPQPQFGREMPANHPINAAAAEGVKQYFPQAKPPTPPPAKPPVNTGAMKPLTPTPIPKIAEIIKRASRSDALGKVLDINNVDPADIDYYDEEYVEELSQRKAAQEDDKASKNTPCSCGCGDTVSTCKCAQSCSCRKPGGSCYKGEKKADATADYVNYAAEIEKQRGTPAFDRWLELTGEHDDNAESGQHEFNDPAAIANMIAKHKALMAKTAGSTPAWQRSEGKNSEGGLNAKGRASYNKATGGNLKAPVTEANPKGKRAKRQNSFCARMCGMKRVNTGAGTAKDPDSRINKSLRKWNCKCSSAMEFGIKLAGQPFLGPSTDPKDPRVMLGNVVGPQQTQAYQQRMQRGVSAMDKLMGKSQAPSPPAVGGGMLGGGRGGLLGHFMGTGNK